MTKMKTVFSCAAALAAGLALAAEPSIWAPKLGELETAFYAHCDSNRVATLNVKDGRERKALERMINTRDEAVVWQNPQTAYPTDGRVPHVLRGDTGANNVRDLGGWKGLDGRAVRLGLIYRCAHFPDVNDKDRKLTDAQIFFWTNAIGLKTDLDLRWARDLKKPLNGSPLGANVTWRNRPLKFYAGALHDKKGTAAAFRVMCDRANLPLAFHCQGGKDRAGTLAFLVGALLGVEKDNLLKDFETTWLGMPRNRIGDCAEKMGKVAEGLDAYPGATLAERTAAFFVDCGVTREEIARFREMMLEK